MPSRPATPAPRAASCFATEAVRQGRPEPPPLPFQPHPSPRLRQIKGGVLRSHQPSRPQEVLMGAKVMQPWTSPARQVLEAAFTTVGASSPETRVETTSIFAALHLVREAGMVGALPSTILSESVARADLVRLPISLPNTLLQYGIVTRRGEPLSANALEFIPVIREQYAAIKA